MMLLESRPQDSRKTGLLAEIPISTSEKEEIIMMHTQISKLCRPVKSVDVDTTVENILNDINWDEMSSVAVVDKNKNVIGIITERDMLFAESVGIKKNDLLAWEICSRKIIKISPEETILGAAQLMIEHKIHHVMVMTGDYLEGIISSLDVIKEVMKSD